MSASFPTTRWSLILSAGQDAEHRRVVLRQIIADYRQPLYVFALRRGLCREDAADATQDFIAHMLGRDMLERVHPDRGRLRVYLRVCFANFLGHQHERARSLKRGGGAERVAFDFEVSESVLREAPLDPSEAYDRAWASLLLARCIDRLIAEYEGGSRRGPASVLRALFGLEAARTYESIAAEHDMTLAQVKSFAHRARVRYRELVINEVADTVAGAPLIGAEALRLTDLVG